MTRIRSSSISGAPSEWVQMASSKARARHLHRRCSNFVARIGLSASHPAGTGPESADRATEARAPRVRSRTDRQPRVDIAGGMLRGRGRGLFLRPAARETGCNDLLRRATPAGVRSLPRARSAPLPPSLIGPGGVVSGARFIADCCAVGAGVSKRATETGRAGLDPTATLRDQKA